MTSLVNEPWTKAGFVGLDVFVFAVQATSRSSVACGASSSLLYPSHRKVFVTKYRLNYMSYHLNGGTVRERPVSPESQAVSRPQKFKYEPAERVTKTRCRFIALAEIHSPMRQ